MEMQWVNSSCIHSGEYFHGPFEVTDYDVPFVITLGNGRTRHLDERALAFARKYSKQLLVIDENDFDLTAVDESLREYFAPIVEAAVVRCMMLAQSKGLPKAKLVINHALRNTLISVITVLAPLLVNLMRL